MMSEATARYVYVKSEPRLWTVGFYEPSGRWQPESDHSSEKAASERVHYLNGGGYAHDALIAQVSELRAALEDLLQVIVTDELIPESVSYMKQARAALAKGGE